jgi:transcriptional regulator with XRE-family HTH domain
MGKQTIDDTKRRKIIRYLKNHSQNETARHFKISPSTVNGIANSTIAKKTFPICSEPTLATKAHKQYAKADRLQVLHKLMGVIDCAIDDPELSPRNLTGIATACAITIDKFRLEEKDADEFGKEKAEVNLMFEMMKKEAKKSDAKPANG